MKRARFGIKIFCICESSGYMHRFRVYSGKENPFTDMDTVLPDEVHNFSKAEKVVLYLVQPLLNKGYTVYMDNYYSTLRLYSYLHEKNTLACGTIRKHRIPQALRNASPAPN